jgi:PAS domain S-box-containing protein
MVDDMSPDSRAEAASTRRADEVRDMYRALLQGELSGTDALTASQQMLQILMDSMTNAVFWKDVDSRYLGCNEVFASFAGFEPAILIGKSDKDMPWELYPTDYDSEWFMSWDQEVVQSGQARFGILEQLRRSDGELRWIETNKVPLRDLDGEVIGVLGTFEDVTDRRRAEEELQLTLEDLDQRVNLRTAELTRANETLRREVEDRIRLQSEEAQQRAFAEALRDTAVAMSATFDLAGVSDAVLDGVGRVVSNDLAVIVLTHPDGSSHVSGHNSGLDYLADRPDIDSVDVNKLTVIELMAKEVGPVIVDDPSSAFGSARSVLAARMQVADQLIGFLLVESAMPGFFSDGHADRLVAVAGQAGAAISNAQLANRISELATAEERQRLARELHDAVNQTLWTAALTSESLLLDVGADSPIHHRVSRLRQLTRGALAEMRSLLLELRPSELSEVGLADLIQSLVDALESRRHMNVTVELESVSLEPATHVACYRIVQGALANVVQHSDASSLRVSLTNGPPTELRIEDDGVGFDSEDVAGGHLGLSIMQERADAVGAILSVESSPGNGTTLRLRMPT